MGQCNKWNTTRRYARVHILCWFSIDLPDVINSKIQIFADDTIKYSTVNDIGDIIHSVLLKEDLTNLYQWSTKWQLKFNVKKCKVMHLGSKNSNVE